MFQSNWTIRRIFLMIKLIEVYLKYVFHKAKPLKPIRIMNLYNKKRLNLRRVKKKQQIILTPRRLLGHRVRFYKQSSKYRLKHRKMTRMEERQNKRRFYLLIFLRLSLPKNRIKLIMLKEQMQKNHIKLLLDIKSNKKRKMKKIHILSCQSRDRICIKFQRRSYLQENIW